MIEYCPNCKKKLYKEFKFCPECGIEIQDSPSNKVELIICPVCGEENDSGNSTCISCGALINKISANVIEKESIKPKKESIPAKEKRKSNKRKSQEEVKPDLKNVSKTTSIRNRDILFIFAGVFLVVLIVLYFSGVFETPTVVQNPGNNQDMMNQGANLSALNEINEFEKLVESNPSNFDNVLKLAHLYNDNGFFDKAIERYKQYLKSNAKNTDAIIDLGVCYFELKQYDVADSIMQSAIKIKPDHQIGLYNLGIVNLSKGDLEKSKQWFNKAIDVDPNSEFALKAKKLLESH